MRKLLGLVVLAALCLGLVACGSDYKEQTVTYKDHFKVTCINDKVVCDQKSIAKDDNLVFTCEVKNISKKDDKFTLYANINPKQGNETLSSSFIKDKKGKIYSFNHNQLIKAGETATLRFAYILKNHEDDVVVNFDGYMMNADAGKMTFKVKGRQTEENKKYEAESKKEFESKKKIKEAKVADAAVVTIPKGWVANNVTKYYFNMERSTDNGTQSISVDSSSMKIASAKAEADRYAANFGKGTKVKEYKVAGEKCYGFEPTSTQFYLFGKASNGYPVKISGMFISYKDAKDILNKNIKFK